MIPVNIKMRNVLYSAFHWSSTLINLFESGNNKGPRLFEALLISKKSSLSKPSMIENGLYIHSQNHYLV